MEVRSAHRSEYSLLHDLLVRAFKEDEGAMFDHLADHDPACRPGNIRVAVREGRVVAVTVLLPRQVRTRTGWAPGAVVTLVACEPEFQRQGYGGATVRDALACAEAQGLAVALLYGHPSYYPRFGFAPVLPHAHLALKPSAGAEPPSRALDADLPWMLKLYDEQLAIYPGAMARTADPWLWAVRYPQTHALLKLPDGQAYAFGGANTQARALDIREAAAADLPAARRLVAALRREAHDRGLEHLRLILPPDAPVARVAALEGAELVMRPAGPGMACITRWEPLLPPGYTVTPEGLSCHGRPVLAAERALLTQLVMGYRSAADLKFLENVSVIDAERLAEDFPPAFPRWSLAPFWFGM